MQYAVSEIHNETASILKYSDENSLRLVYLPRQNSPHPALLIELKWNKSATGATAQIKNRQYSQWIKEYTGDILLVGINFDEKKGHECTIEKLHHVGCPYSSRYIPLKSHIEPLLRCVYGRKIV